MGGIDDRRHASIELDPALGAASAGLVIDDSDHDAPSSGLVIDDRDDDDDDDGDGPSSGLVLDAAPGGAPRSAAPARFGDPMVLTAGDAQRIADGKLETARILGLVDHDALAQLTDAEVQGQVARFTRKLTNLEMQFSDLQKARSRLPGYRSWLDRITTLGKAADAAHQLRAIIEAEDRAAALDELTAYIRFVLDDQRLEWGEHTKVLRKAEQLGLPAAEVEAIYRQFEPFEREAQAAAEQAAVTGWSAHPKLAVAGEVYAWNLARLHDLLLQRFDIAVEIANQPFDKTYSLYDYLDRNRDETHKDRALRAREAADQAQCPALAVWYFLWTTGPVALHLGGKHHRPVRSRKRQIETIDELTALVATDWVIDDLASALEGGLLETWLFVVTRDDRVFQTTAALRIASRGISDRKRPGFLRQAVIRVLWQLGFRGLPLLDDARRSVVVGDLAQLTSQAEACWEFLEWTLHSGVLAEWLDQFDPTQAGRARTCAAMVSE